MAYVEEFTIKGLAARERVVHRVLDRHVNIFWGLNGTGKTSLLKILHAALSNQVKGLEHVPFESAEVIFWTTAHDGRIKRTLVKADAVENEDDEDAPRGYPSEFEQVGEHLWREVPVEGKAWKTEILNEAQVPRPEAPFRHSYMPISRLSDLSERHTRARYAGIGEDTLDENFADEVQLRWQRYNTEALASIRKIQQQGLASILAHLFGGGLGQAATNPQEVTAAEAYTLVQGFLMEQGISLRFGKPEFLRRYEDQKDLRNVVANIQEVTQEVEEALRPQHEFQRVIERLYSGGKQLVLGSARFARGGISVEIDGNPIPLRALSSGEKQLLRLTLETLAADEDVVMIDEPELSMHVDWQQVLVESMRRVNPDCQLLLATHSPEVMAEVDEQFVFEL